MKKGKIVIDLEEDIVSFEKNGKRDAFTMDSKEAFELVSKAYLRCGWDNKYVYRFSWMGRPIIQLPDDLIRIQELIYEIKPDIIIETGVAHGGSIIYSASLLEMIGVTDPKVIGIDIEIRPHNRKAIEAHKMFPFIDLIEGNSVSSDVLSAVAKQINDQSNVLVFLDSCHTKDHVLKELELYSSFVSPGSYIVAMDGIMKDLAGAPRSHSDWGWNNPTSAATEFVENNPSFEIVEPKIPFNEGNISKDVSYFPSAYIQRIK